MGRYDPPFQITDEIMNLTAPISEQLGHIDSRSRETIPSIPSSNQPDPHNPFFTRDRAQFPLARASHRTH